MLFQECSHYCELISGAKQMPRALEIAIRQAVGKRGVSVVVIPGDVALAAGVRCAGAKAVGPAAARPVVYAGRRRSRRAGGDAEWQARVTAACAARDGRARTISSLRSASG